MGFWIKSPATLGKMDEFSLIEKYLAPLAKGCSGAFSLTDDAAAIAPEKGNQFVITKDAIAEGVHFLAKTSPELIAKKLLRTNLSDIAAMGAQPKYYLIAAMLTPEINEDWIKKFAKTLAEEQKIFGLHLIGGDTIKTKGPLAFSLTMLGEAKNGKTLRRNGAKPGDVIYVSGTIGDAALGLKILQGEITAAKPAEKFLIERYLIPQSRMELGRKLSRIASSCIDISDGLAADLVHICDVSQVSGIIEKEKIPISKGAREILAARPQLWHSVISGGDDYELLFTVPPKREKMLKKFKNITRIGRIGKKSANPLKITENGREIPLKSPGYKHF